jgi:hypothetical protein
MISTRGAVIALVAAVNTGLLAWTVQRYSPSHEHGPAYGERFPLERASTLDGETVEWSGRWLAAIGFAADSGQGAKLARYATILRRKYGEDRVAIVAFVSGAAKGIERLQRDVIGFGYPLIQVTGDIEERLKTKEHPNWVFLVNPGGRVVFSAPVLLEDDLRQLLEQNLLGKVSYEPARHATSLTRGSPLPSVELTDMRTGSVLDLKSLKNRDLVFVTARCTICQLVPALKIYQRLESEAPLRNGVMIFSRRFHPGEVLRQAQRNGVKSPLLQEVTLTEALEDSYLINGFAGHEVVVISVDAAGSVKEITAWPEFIRPFGES